MNRESSYFDIVRRSEIKEENRRLRRLFLRYKEAELVYSIQHKKLLELAGKAGAIYRIDGTVLINREIFEDYLEFKNYIYTTKYTKLLSEAED